MPTLNEEEDVSEETPEGDEDLEEFGETESEEDI